MFLSCSRHNIVSPRHSPSDKVEKEKIALLPAGKAETKDGMLIKTTNRLFRCTRAVGLFNGKHLEDIAQEEAPRCPPSMERTALEEEGGGCSCFICHPLRNVPSPRPPPFPPLLLPLLLLLLAAAATPTPVVIPGHSQGTEWLGLYVFN